MTKGSGANPRIEQRQPGHHSAAMSLDIYVELKEDNLDTVA
ncbi:integrase [Corynebacterium amycolatum]|nr:integrase [Corynebacterium amycolatum]KAA9245012.1 integrase [Corynebacterium amycolatum]